MRKLKPYVSNHAPRVEGRVYKMFILKHHVQDSLYEASREQIANEQKASHRHADANERLLFHGTSWDAADSIEKTGFDDRFWTTGSFGRGMYFADDICKSHDYPIGGDTKTMGGKKCHVMFYSHVLLGNQQVVDQACTDRNAADAGYHSVFYKAHSGTAN